MQIHPKGFPLSNAKGTQRCAKMRCSIILCGTLRVLCDLCGRCLRDSACPLRPLREMLARLRVSSATSAGDAFETPRTLCDLRGRFDPFDACTERGRSSRYPFQAVEEKWRPVWETMQLDATGNDPDKPNIYILDYFPYPSGSGLSVGHGKKSRNGMLFVR